MYSDDSVTAALSRVKNSLRFSLEHKYDREVDIDKLMAVHGLAKSNFDFIKNVEDIIAKGIVDTSIDQNSNKNEVTVAGIMKEATDSVSKIVGYRALYRKLKELYGKKEAKRLTGEMYDFSLALSDSTKIMIPYSYYKNTPILVRINGVIKYMKLSTLYGIFAEQEVYNGESDCHIIDATDLKKSVQVTSVAIRNSKVKTDTRDFNNWVMKAPIKEKVVVEVWDNSSWVGVSQMLRHKNERDFVLYQTNSGNFALVTEDHPVILSDGIEKLASELVIGDAVLEKDMLPSFDEKIDIPTDLAYFIGFLLGDGNYTCYDIANEHYSPNYDGRALQFTRGGNLITIYQNDIDNAYITKVAKRLFPKANFFKVTDKSDRQINFASAEFNYLLSFYFGFSYKENSFTKHLPENILEWTREAKLALIAGLIDSDGNIFKKTGRIEIRMQAYAIINGLYDVIKSLGDSFCSVYKRIDGNDIATSVFGISFREVGDDLIKYSEKIQQLSQNGFERKVYDKDHDVAPRDGRVSKIMKFNRSDINVSRFLFDELEEVYDITTDSGTFYANGMKQHNCYALDCTKIVIEGRPFGQLPSAPPKRLSSYIAALNETIHQLSSHAAGALAVGSFFLDVAHVLLYREKVTPETWDKYYIQNCYQTFVHSVNHLSRNAVESPFSNISIFDRPKLEALLSEDNMGWYFPYEKGYGQSKETWIGYIIDAIMELQNIFMEFFDKGDPIRNGVPYRFPVVTINLSKEKKGTAIRLMDEAFVKRIAKHEIYRYNILVSEGTRVASCCRLLSDADMLEIGGQVNSFGGAGISLGSHRVITTNFNRIALSATSYEDYLAKIEDRAEDSAMILKAHKELLREEAKDGILPFVSNGYMRLERMFSTFGVLGLFEAGETINARFEVEEDVVGASLKLLNKCVNELSTKYGIIGNIEQIPGETMAVKLCNVDKMIFGEGAVPYTMYANQFIPLWKDATIWERMEVDGAYNKLFTGGGIVHFNLGERLTSQQIRKIIDFAATSGCEHFALNSVYSSCKAGHFSFGNLDTCPICGEPITEKFTRVVGFFVPVSSWNATRREWEFPQRDFKGIE